MDNQLILGYVVLYLCSVSFLLGIISGSLEYYTALLSPSPESLDAFFQQQPGLSRYLRYLFPFKEWEFYIKYASKTKSFIIRIVSSLFFVGFILFYLKRSIVSFQSGDILALFLNLVGILICFACLRYGWQFGRNLSAVI